VALRDLLILERSIADDESAGTFVDHAAPCVVTSIDPAPVLDLPHSNAEARTLFGRHAPITIDGLVWVEPGAPLPSRWRANYVERFRLALESHPGWRPASSTEAEPLDVVKQVSFLHASDGTDEPTFRAHYRHHVEVARRHMPALWQYVQNDVVGASGNAASAQGVVAVSELWFRTTDDFLHRYFPSEEDRRAFSAQEGFLDLSQATSFVCTSHLLADAEPAR
jgi:hypothetical protein